MGLSGHVTPDIAGADDDNPLSGFDGVRFCGNQKVQGRDQTFRAGNGKGSGPLSPYGHHHGVIADRKRQALAGLPACPAGGFRRGE